MHLPFLLPTLLLATSTLAKDAYPLLRSRFRSRINNSPSRRATSVYQRANCEPAEPTNTVTDRLNQLLSSGGPGYTLSLCPNQNYPIVAPLQFTNVNQEISTQGLPTDGSRAILTISGPVLQPNQDNHTTAVDGQCATCNGVKLRHIQINGSRGGAQAVDGGANIEMGGANSGQLVEYVRSFDPRSWSCLHIAEGSLNCTKALVQNNDIGPCGSDAFDQWADGISVACANTIVRNNLVNTPTDGGIVLFGSPGSLVENNTIWVENNTLLGGINMVDYDPWFGDYEGTVVRQNNIVGGLATSAPTSASDKDGTNNDDVIIKIGIAMGPHIWFGDHFLANVSQGGTVENNRFEGAFGYAMAIASTSNFTVQNNILVGNTSFIGSRGPNCSSVDQTPSSQPFVANLDSISDSSLQHDFTNISDGDSLTCIVPPPGGDFWPFGGNHAPDAPPDVPGEPSPAVVRSGGTSTGTKVGLALGIIAGVLLVAVLCFFVRKWAIARKRRQRNPTTWATAPKEGRYVTA
ncbi:hypothetical protein K439DRAFT_1643763 [Ramaria rubella]|nr:hypothetical protein K439DRAFT_1643763 [Ramaria rubella]